VISSTFIDEEKIVEFMVREMTKREALRRLAADEAETVTIPELKVFADLMLVEMAQTQYRIDNWQPVNSRVILSAQNKSGKTTMRDNLVRSLVDGVPWLDSAAVEPVGIVTIIDNEMSEGQAIRWLKDQGIENTYAINFVALRGKVSSFNILDKAMRSRWADILRGTDYLIFDCLRPALDAFGLDEQRDAGKFLLPFDELMAEAGINESLIVHHMGHTSGRSRGDSRLRDWPDVEWFLERKSADDPASPRTVRAYGRDVDVPEGRLAFNPTTRHLTYRPVMPIKMSKQQAATAAIDKHLKDHREAGQRELEALANITTDFSRADIRVALCAGDAEKRYTSRPGPKRSKLWRKADIGGTLETA